MNIAHLSPADHGGRFFTTLTDSAPDTLHDHPAYVRGQCALLAAFASACGRCAAPHRSAGESYFRSEPTRAIKKNNTHFLRVDGVKPSVTYLGSVSFLMSIPVLLKSLRGVFAQLLAKIGVCHGDHRLSALTERKTRPHHGSTHGLFSHWCQCNENIISEIGTFCKRGNGKGYNHQT